MNIDVMYSSKSNEWATPMDFFKKLDQEFHFNLDPCSTDENHKCDKYYTIKDDGLQKNWGGTECFVIHHTVRRLVSGLRSVTGKVLRIIP
jgi:site-specific DNA-methyltransferase (adenine-specific)